jgi:hypothetical protein
VNEPGGEIRRWREAFAGLSERGMPGPECPDPDRIWAAATGEGTAEERQEVIAHTATCASCAGAFRLALGLSREERQGSAGIEPIAGPWFQRTGSLAALAAALLLAVLLPILWRAQQGPPQYRDDGETVEIRSQIPEDAVLPRQQAVLRWSAGPPGSLYEVRLLTREAREVAVETGLEEPRYQIPPAALEGLPAGTVLYWQVKALRPDGTSGVSKTFTVRLQ